MERKYMDYEEELEHVNELYEAYEKEGFSKVFINTEESDDRQGKTFKVLYRHREQTETDYGKDTKPLEYLPVWRIQFEDGHEADAFPEEIIPSEIRDAIWREEDFHLLELM